jgi:enamine deaminase RidA (YjgF/YER057c/UK114 family)
MYLSLGLVTLSPGYSQSPTHIQTDKNSPFASAIWAGDTLYVSGQIAK